jgi:hypothetical protein
MKLWLEIQQMLNANRTEENLKKGRNRRLIGEHTPSRPAPNGTSIPYTPLAQLPHVRTLTSHLLRIYHTIKLSHITHHTIIQSYSLILSFHSYDRLLEQHLRSEPLPSFQAQLLGKAPTISLWKGGSGTSTQSNVPSSPPPPPTTTTTGSSATATDERPHSNRSDDHKSATEAAPNTPKSNEEQTSQPESPKTKSPPTSETESKGYIFQNHSNQIKSNYLLMI